MRISTNITDRISKCHQTRTQYIVGHIDNRSTNSGMGIIFLLFNQRSCLRCRKNRLRALYKCRSRCRIFRNEIYSWLEHTECVLSWMVDSIGKWFFVESVSVSTVIFISFFLDDLWELHKKWIIMSNQWRTTTVYTKEGVEWIQSGGDWAIADGTQLDLDRIGFGIKFVL